MRDSYQIPKAFLDIVTESQSIRRRFWAFVATLISFVGNQEIKPSNKTKEEIVYSIERFSLRLITSNIRNDIVYESGLTRRTTRLEIFFNETLRIPPNKKKKSIRGDSGDSWPVWNRGIREAFP